MILRKALRTVSIRAFSLIELLVVIAVLAVLASLAVPALTTVMKAGKVSQAASQMAGVLSLGAQIASSQNRPVTVRLIANPDGEYQFFQLVAREPNGTIEPLDRVQRLPDNISMSTNSTYSSVFELPELISTPDDPVLPGVGGVYRYREIELRPDGRLGISSPNVLTTRWYVTLVPTTDDTNSTSLPSNYATIQIDPVNSRLTVYRP